MQNCKFILWICLFILNTHIVHSQVTIGSGTKPSSGMILDLKQQEVANGEADANKGLLLPRVSLTNKSNLFPMFQKDDTSYKDDKKDEQDLIHAGLIVYNMNECLMTTGDDRGVYIWDGESWMSLGKNSSSNFNVINTYYDQDGNPFKARTFGNGAGEWMVQNLQVKKFDDGSGEVLSNNPNTAINGMIWANPVNSETYPEIGYLYNGLAVLGGPITKSNEGAGEASALISGYQGICPKGWHVPSDLEWIKLEKELYENAKLYSTQANLTNWNINWNTTSENLAVPTIGDVLTDPCLLKADDLAPDKGQGKSLFFTQGGFSAKLAVGAGATDEYIARFWTSSASNNGNLWTRYTSTKFNSDGTINTHIGSLNRIGNQTVNGETSLASIRCKRNEGFIRCGDPLADVEGNIYSTAKFGNTCWTTSNMRTEIYADQTSINPSDYTILDATAVEEVGYLYSWNATTKGVSNDFIMVDNTSAHNSEVQGICPTGWFVPSEKDWVELESYIDAEYSDHSTFEGTHTETWDSEHAIIYGHLPGEEISGGWAKFLKSASLNGLSNHQDDNGFSLHGSGATAGSANLTLPDWDDHSYIWTSSSAIKPLSGEASAVYREVFAHDEDVYHGIASKTSKMSVRCVQQIP